MLGGQGRSGGRTAVQGKCSDHVSHVSVVRRGTGRLGAGGQGWGGEGRLLGRAVVEGKSSDHVSHVSAIGRGVGGRGRCCWVQLGGWG